MIPGLGFSKTHRNLKLTNRILVFLRFRSVWKILFCQLSYPSKKCSNTASTQSRLSLSNDTILDTVTRTVLTVIQTVQWPRIPGSLRPDRSLKTGCETGQDNPASRNKISFEPIYHCIRAYFARNNCRSILLKINDDFQLNKWIKKGLTQTV